MDVVPGNFSPLGRQTERTLRRLRTQVEAEQLDWSPKTPGRQGAGTRGRSPKIVEFLMENQWYIS